MSKIEAIKSKYGYDSGLTVNVDISSLREEANEILSNVNNFQKTNSPEDDQWIRRWSNRTSNSIKEQRRCVELASKMLNEVLGILDKAESKLKEL